MKKPQLIFLHIKNRMALLARFSTALLCFYFLFSAENLFAQSVGISTTGAAPDPSAMLDVASTDKGLLIPRVALVSATNPIASPTTSLLVYNTSTTGTFSTPGYYYFNGTTWIQLQTAGGGGSGWGLNGNAGTTPGVGVGQNFVGTSDNKDLVIGANSTAQITAKSGGSIKLSGDLENQELTGSAVTYGGAAISDPASTTLAVTPTAATLWLSSTVICPSCNNTYSQNFGNTNATAEVIDGTVQSIVVNDGSGSANSGVLILANVTIKTITSSNGSNGFRYMIWVQRSTDPTFASNGTNIYKVEDGIASGLFYGGATNIADNVGAGISNTSIIYPDLGLSPGTYYYRLVYQSILSGSNNQTPAAQDRSMVLLQIKR